LLSLVRSTRALQDCSDRVLAEPDMAADQPVAQTSLCQLEDLLRLAVRWTLSWLAAGQGFDTSPPTTRAGAREGSVFPKCCKGEPQVDERLSHSRTRDAAQHRNFSWYRQLLGVLFGTHGCHRQQSTDESENRCNRLVFLAPSSTIFAAISAVSENARENPLARG
jgi:hypothetical protein